MKRGAWQVRQWQPMGGLSGHRCPGGMRGMLTMATNGAHTGERLGKAHAQAGTTRIWIGSMVTTTIRVQMKHLKI
jgi:hypothetical protein